LLFLGKLLVVGIVGVCSFFWFDKLNSDDPDSLQYDVVPTIVSSRLFLSSTAIRAPFAVLL